MGILWIYEIMFSGLDSRVPCEHSCFHSWYFSLGIVTFLLQLGRHQWSLDQIWTIYVFDIEWRETLQSSTSQCSISRAATIRAHLFCIPAFPSLYSLVPCIARVVATMKWCEHIYIYIHTYSSYTYTHTYIYVICIYFGACHRNTSHADAKLSDTLCPNRNGRLDHGWMGGIVMWTAPERFRPHQQIVKVHDPCSPSFSSFSKLTSSYIPILICCVIYHMDVVSTDDYIYLIYIHMYLLLLFFTILPALLELLLVHSPFFLNKYQWFPLVFMDFRPLQPSAIGIKRDCLSAAVATEMAMMTWCHKSPKAPKWMVYTIPKW